MRHSQNQIMNRGQDPSGRADGHAGSIFVKSHIPSIMQSGFDQPMLTPDAQDFRGRSLVSTKAGYTILGLTTGFVDHTLADPGELTFQAVDLPNAGAVYVIIEHATGLNAVLFQSSMSQIDLAGAQEVGRDLAETRFGLIWGEQALDIFIKARLVLLDRPQIMATSLDNLGRNGP